MWKGLRGKWIMMALRSNWVWERFFFPLVHCECKSLQDPGCVFMCVCMGNLIKTSAHSVTCDYMEQYVWWHCTVNVKWSTTSRVQPVTATSAVHTVPLWRKKHWHNKHCICFTLFPAFHSVPQKPVQEPHADHALLADLWTSTALWTVSQPSSSVGYRWHVTPTAGASTITLKQTAATGAGLGRSTDQSWKHAV